MATASRKQASKTASVTTLDQLRQSIQQAKPRLVGKGNVMNPATSQQVSKALRYLADLSSSVHDNKKHKKHERLYPQLPPTPQRQKRKTPPLSLPSAPPLQLLPSFQSLPSYEQSMRRKTANTSIQPQPQPPSYEQSMMRKKIAMPSQYYCRKIGKDDSVIKQHLEKVKQVYSIFLLEKKKHKQLNSFNTRSKKMLWINES